MKKILFSAIAIVAMAGCSKTESVEIDNWSGELRITSGIESRASETLWEENDMIGVFMSETEKTTAVGLHNSQYTTDSKIGTADFSPYTGVTPLYYPQSGNVDIVAHYPYSTAAGVDVDSYPVNVATQSDLTAIDFMSSKSVDVEKSSSALNLTFYHLLTQVKVTLEPGTGMTAAELETATVKISGTKVAATAELDYDTVASKPTADYTLSGDAASLSVAAVSSTATFIVVPQEASVKFTVTVAGIGDLVTTAQTLTFASGYEQTYKISVTRTAASIKSTTISGWGTGTVTDSSFEARVDEN